LYRKFDAEGRQQKDNGYAEELDQIADEYYEDDEDHSKPSLDEVFDQALNSDPRLRASQRLRTKTRPSKDDTPNAELEKAPSGRRKGVNEDAAKLKQMRVAELERVDKLIRNAPTDRALWQTLDREVFAKVRALDLDNDSEGPLEVSSARTSSATSKTSSKPKTVHKPDPPTTEARILFQNYPHHLVTAIATLRTEFPSSPLPFSILPTIKRLGRSSHALGATTTLYRHLIRTAWIQQSSYTTINALLTEMDASAIEFDADILALLDAIIKEHNQARGGELGRELSLVFSMEMFVDGLQKIVTWRDVIAERLGMKSERRRAASKIVRSVTPLEQKPWRAIKSQGKAAYTQKPRERSRDGAPEYVPLVEGANPGVGGPRTETASAEDADNERAEVLV
jgi:hypothetical protein